MKNPYSLRSLLESYPVTNEVEEAQQRRMLTLLKKTKHPFSRSTLKPGHFTASSFVLDPRGEQVLMILHRSLGLWLQPGGHFEGDDSDLEAAARREVLEETGLKDLKRINTFSGLFDIDIHSIPPNPKKGEGAHEHFDLRLAFVATTDRLHAAEEVVSARWVPLDHVADLGTDESVLRCIGRLQRSKDSFSGTSNLL